MSTDEYEAITEAEWKVLATTEITHLTDEEKDYLPRAWDEWIARVRRDAAYVAWHEGQASGWRSAQEECEANGMVGDLYHPHTETEPCPYAAEETP